MGLGDRLKHAWNAFFNKDPTNDSREYEGYGSSYRPDRYRLSRGNDRTIINSIFTRISMDTAAIPIKHVRLDENDRYLETIESGLNNCLTLEANIDQTGRAFVQDIVISMLDEGCVAVVPTDTSTDPRNSNSYEIEKLRVGKIISWYPETVRVELYNEKVGRKQEVTLPKHMVSIVENPLYSVFNEPNSTMQRLIRKLSLLDYIDENNSSGKLDLIIQLPYVIKSEARRIQAEQRRKDIEKQLAGSKYGIAYTDGTEHITQLNRAVENNLLSQVEYLTRILYGQLGLTEAVMNGTADEKTMLNYYNQTIEPILSAITDEMKRKFLTKTARTQGQSIMFIRDPFRLVPITELATIADTFTRNEIMTSNELRQIVGLKPSTDPNADELRNKNLNKSNEELAGGTNPVYDDMGFIPEDEEVPTEEELEDLNGLDKQIDELEYMLAHSDEFLEHYASPYYDPVKANEYYEEHKKLKGRRSVATLNDKGREAAAYVKESLTNERKAKVATHKTETDSKVNKINSSKKSQIERHKVQMQSKIDKLKDQLKSMSKDDRKANRERFSNIIAALREENRSVRERLLINAKSNVSSARENHRDYKEKTKEEYDQKYIDELDALRSDSRYVKPVTRRRKS